MLGNDVSRRYNRTTLLERRVPLMQEWADYVCGTDASNVIPLRRA